MVSLAIKRKNIPLLEVCIIAFLYILKNIYYIRNASGLLFGIGLIENILYILVLFSILHSSYKTKQFFLIAGCVVVLFLCYLHTGQADLLKGFIVILSLKNLACDDVFRALGNTYILGIAIAIILYFLGISDPGILRRNGMALGFATTNIASRVIQTALFLILVSSKNAGKKYRIVVICVVIGFSTYIITESRMSLILMLAYPIVSGVVNMAISSRKKNIWRNITLVIPVVLLFTSVIITQLYNSNVSVQFLNLAFSNRIYMNLVALQEYGITVFGTAANISSFSGIFDVVADKYVNFLTIDSQYIYLLVYYGFLGTALVIGSLTLCVKKAWDYENGSIVTVLLLLSVYMFTETLGSIFGLPFLIYLSSKVQEFQLEVKKGG